MENIPLAVCDGLEFVGAPCATQIMVIKLWHLIAGLVIFGLVATIVWFLRRNNRLENLDRLREMSAPYGAIPEARTIRVNPHAFAKAIGERGYDELNRTNAAKRLNEKYGDRYFVVQFRERGKRKFSRELKIQAWHISLAENEFRLDPETLDTLKGASDSQLDDELGDNFGADGTFDIFFRKVRWWDIRHWLNHPAREIRYALYVAIFATCLEYSGYILGFLKLVMQVPG